VNHGLHGVIRYYYNKNYGFSVRCERNPPNQPPAQPSSPYPPNSSTNQSINPQLLWLCSDPENDPLTYDVYFDTNNPPAQVSTGQTGSNYDPGTLLYSTTYYWRIVAHDDHGHSTEGPLWQFATMGQPCPGPTITYGGQVYNTVQIGTQCWLKENLNIGTIINGSANQTNNGQIEKYCYDDDEFNCDVYGGLYQWNEMMQYVTTPGVKGICPDGWYLPTDAEWTDLTTYLGGESVAGGKMKESGYIHWAPPNTGATNSSGFTALPGGSSYDGGNFYYLTSNGKFWSSTQQNNYYAWERNLSYYNALVARNNSTKSSGKSVRCLKDQGAP